MIKKFLILTLWVLSLGTLLAGCYIVGILQNWTFSSILLFWVGMLLAILSIRILYSMVNVFFKEGYYHKILVKCRLSRKERVLLSSLRKGREILKSKRFKRSGVPWFILLGNHHDKGSLLNGTSHTLLYDTNENALSTPLNTIRWLFFKKVAFLELSDGLINTVSSNITWRLLKWMRKNPSTSGIVLFLSISELLNSEKKEIQNEAIKFRKIIDGICLKVKRRIPVYLFVTGCNDIEGFSLWSKKIDYLEESIPLGFSWDNSPYITDKGNDHIHQGFTKLKKSLNFLRIKLIENESSISDRHGLLSFPEILCSLEQPVNIFVSELCESDAYFAETNLSGIWFTDVIDSDATMYKSQSDILLSDLLPTLSYREFGNHTHWRSSNVIKMAILSITLLMLSYSAYQTGSMLKETNDSSPEVIVQSLLNYEKYYKSSLIHIPFLPALHWQESRYYEQLRKETPFQQQSVRDIIASYRNKFHISSPSQKRDLILQLARSIIIWGKLHNGLLFANEEPDIIIPSELKLTKTSGDVSRIISLAIERSEINSENGKAKLDELRIFLNELIGYDPSLSWLLAPAENIPDLSSNLFWPDSDRAIYLSGIWTAKGQGTLYEWIELLAKSSGKKQSAPEFSDFIKKLPGLRQDAWREFIISVSHERNPNYAVRTKRELLDVMYKKTPEAKFFQHLKNDLDDIPDIQAHDWLIKFRQLVSLQTLSRESNFIRRLQQSEILMRMRITTALRREITPLTSTQLVSWWGGVDALHSAINEALNDEFTGDYLIRGLFTKALDKSNPNPLLSVFDNLNKVKYYLYHNDTDPVVDAIWNLYENQSYIILDNAIARAGSWLNKKWRQSVLLPLQKERDDFDHLSLQDNAYKYLVDFLHGPAKVFFTLAEDNFHPPSFRGRSFPVQESFIKLVNKVIAPEDLLNTPLGGYTRDQDDLVNIQTKLAALHTELRNVETVPYTLTVSSAPTTISRGARIIPTGTRLKLECQFDSSILDSMNFADSADFTWRAGQCQNVSIDVLFPGFTARYKLSGDTAWPDFLKLFTDGEAELATEKFPHESAETLSALGIQSILVRYKISESASLISAFEQWHRIKDEINYLTDKQIQLSEKKSLKAVVNKIGWLSQLPNEVFECQSTQE
ncbi:TPA: hypothetical protein PGG59_000274 [Raoultella planticola]|nr:hypothetical protein [Raoultella planticola]